jgi:Ca2+-binding RTX toxin-like protein
MISARTRSGSVTIQSRLRRSRITEVDIASRGAGGPYAIDFVEAGRDLIGNNRANRLRCRAGVNYVEARGGNDRIVCGSGADMIVPGRGRDVVAAGRGDDIILVARRDRHRGVETIDGGAGTDVVEFEGGRRRTVRLARGRAIVVSGAARYRLTGVEVVLFGQKR